MTSVVLLSAKHPGARTHGARLKRQAAGFLTELKLEDTELSLAIVTDREIKKLNKLWRDKDRPTDVLSFPADPLPKGVPGPRPLGDVIISLDTARRQAKEYARPLAEELARYLAHGILHLLGHDHLQPREARKMSKLEDRLLGSPGMLATSEEV